MLENTWIVLEKDMVNSLSTESFWLKHHTEKIGKKFNVPFYFEPLKKVHHVIAVSASPLKMGNKILSNVVIKGCKTYWQWRWVIQGDFFSLCNGVELYCEQPIEANTFHFLEVGEKPSLGVFCEINLNKKMK